MSTGPEEHRLLRAMRRRPVDCTPVWFMRQAGRYMEEYRAVRRKHSMMEVCTTPELAVEVTLQPIRRFPDIDAAIIFSDLLLILRPMGMGVDFPKDGPAIANPVRTAADVDALRPVEPERDLAPVLEAIREVRRQLDGNPPLIGFCGAPFTLASYVIEGGSSKHFALTKGLMATEPETWDKLMNKLVDAAIALLRAQAAAGAQALQVFDSWVGTLGPHDYSKHVLPHMKRLFSELSGLDVPVINFATGTSGILELIAEAGGDVIGVDWRTPLDTAWARLGDVAVQGNLDPSALLGPREELLQRVDDVLDRAGGRNGHVFNLGHGILPPTPPENVAAVIERVHEKTKR